MRRFAVRSAVNSTSIQYTQPARVFSVASGGGKEAFESGVVIEDYPSDKYGPSCLILGYTKAGRPLHVHCTHPIRTRIKIITVYEPDPGEWDAFKRKRSQ